MPKVEGVHMLCSYDHKGGEMPRPRKTRLVSGHPEMAAFVPKGISVKGKVEMSVEEFEAIRLSDFEKLDQESGAAMMGVSRHTFGRLLARARGVVADALVNGKELSISGGNYQFREEGCLERMGRGHGRGGGRRHR